MNKIKGSFAAKAAAWVGITLSGIVFVASVFGAMLMEELDIYGKSEQEVREWAIETTCEHYAVMALDKMQNPEKEVDFGQYFRYGIIEAEKIEANRSETGSIENEIHEAESDGIEIHGVESLEAESLEDVDLNDEGIYIEKTFARQISADEVYLVSHEVGEHTEFHYTDTLFGGYSVYDSWSAVSNTVVDYICYNIEDGIFYYATGEELYPVLNVAITMSPDGERLATYEFQYDWNMAMYENLGEVVYDIDGEAIDTKEVRTTSSSTYPATDETTVSEYEEMDKSSLESASVEEVNENIDANKSTSEKELERQIAAEKILNEDYIIFSMLDNTTASHERWEKITFDNGRVCLPEEILYVDNDWMSNRMLVYADTMDYYLVGDYCLEIVPQEENDTEKTYWVVCVVPDSIGLGWSDDLLVQANTLVTFAYNFRYSIYVIAAAAVAIGIFCFVFLINAAGHRKGTAEIKETWLDKSPFDLYLAMFYCVEVLLFHILEELSYRMFRVPIAVLFVSIALCMCWLCLLTILTFAVRIKTKQWWKNTIIAWIISSIYRGIKFLLKNIPLLWRVVGCMAVIVLVEFLNMVALVNGNGGAIWFWFLETAALGIFAFCIAVWMRTLKDGGEKIASGDLDYHVETAHMLPEFREHGENLNNISKGIALAVEDRMKSERFKTELITNVSHDIKTPLTSIINYVDLLQKEELHNETAEEYLEVLSRQSARLKKLIEDLMEASKASTGNLAVNLERLEAGVSMVQTIGEFEEKTESCGLELLIKKPEKPVYIMADSRHFWRVIDNLMNNICKYAQPSTRVYIDLEETGGNVIITFRNTSRYPLNITSEELMERFVRGDSSRNTEGSGLGLSIAKSLMELMNGSLELYVDGDLFKVILKFTSVTA